jgi:hypothetical protein
MPKVEKLRPDGASLADVYHSKQEDTWAKILHGQIAQEVSECLLYIKLVIYILYKHGYIYINMDIINDIIVLLLLLL